MTATRDEFLQELRGAGRLDSRGFFSLDPRKAREKMRQFQLADPHQCILEWIQAAVAGGATRLVVQADVQELVLTATGWFLDPEFLRQPLAGLFISQEKSELECYRHLSIGLNAALALAPSLLEVTTGGSTLRMWGAENLELADASADSAGDGPVTRIRCVQRWSWKLAQRAFLVLRSGVPEEDMILQRAALCPVELHLGERVVTKGGWRDLHPPRLPDDRVVLSRPYEGRLFRGVLDLPARPPEAGLVHVVKHGISVATRTLHTSSLEFNAVIHADRLLTTASHSDIVEDDRWWSLIWELDKAGHDLLLGACRRFETDSAMLRPHLLAALARLAGSTPKGPEARQARDALLALPLFRTTAGEACSFTRLRERCSDKQGRAYYHIGEVTRPLPEDEFVVLLDSDDWKVVRGLLGTGAMVDVRSDARLMKRAANQHRWRQAALRAEGRLALPFPAESLCEIGLGGGGFTGSLALRSYPRAESAGQVRRAYPATVNFFVGGRMLVSRTLPFGGRFFQAAIGHPAFKPNYTYDGIEEDAVFREACRHLVVRYSGLLYRWLASADDASLRQDVTSKRLHLMDHLDAVTSEGRAVKSLPAELLDHPLLATVSGRLASLADLLRDVEEFGAVHWVEGDMRGPQADHRQVVQADIDLEAWYGARPLLPLLRRLFPGKVVDYTSRLQAQRRAMERRQGPREEWSLTGRVLLAVEVRGERLRGELGLALPAAVASAEGIGPAPAVGSRGTPKSRKQGGKKGRSGGAQARAGASDPVADSTLCLTLLKEGRPVETRVMPFPCGPLEAVVDSEDLEVNGDWDRVEPGPGLEAAEAAIHEAARLLATAVAREILAFTGWKREVSETFLMGYVSWKRSDLPSEVEQVPLFPCLEEWRRLTLADVRQEIAATGSIGYVMERPARPGSPVDGRPFLLLTGQSGRVLRALVGDSALRDATRDLEEQLAHRNFLARPTEELALSASVPSWLVRRPIEGNPPGEAGIMPLDDDFDGTVLLRVQREDRPLTRLVILMAVPGEVVLASDDLAVSRDWNGLATEADEDALRERGRQAIEHCLETLASGEVVAHSPESLVLTRYVVAQARDIQQCLRLPPENLAGRLARLRMFEDSTGEPGTLLDLVEAAADEGRLRYVPTGVRGRPASGRVFVLMPPELRILVRMFRKFTPYAPQLADETQAATRKSQARAVDTSSFARERALAVIDLERGELHGVLAVCPDQAGEVVLASEGLEVQRVALFGTLPVVGVLEGTLLRPDRAWSCIELSERVRKRLDRVLDELYARIAGQLATEVARRVTVEATGGAGGGAPTVAGSAGRAATDADRVAALPDAGGDARDALLAYYVHRRHHLSQSAGTEGPEVAVPLFPTWGDHVLTLADVVRIRLARGTLAVAWRAPVGGETVLRAEGWSVAFFRAFFGQAVVQEVDSVLRDIAATLGTVTDPLRSGVRAVVQVAARGFGVMRERFEAMASEARAQRTAELVEERRRRIEEERVAETEERRRRNRLRAAEREAAHVPPPAHVDPRVQARKEFMVLLRGCLEGVPGWRRTRFHEELIRNLAWSPTLPDRLLVRVDRRHVLLNAAHPLADRAVDLRADRHVLAMFASAVVTAINQQLLEVTDEDELLFLSNLATWLR